MLHHVEHRLSNSQKQHGQYRSLIGVMFTTNRPRGPLQTHYEWPRVGLPQTWCFKVIQKSCIERSDTCVRPFIRFYRQRNGLRLSLESIIICVKNFYSFVGVKIFCKFTRCRRNYSRNFCLFIRTYTIIIRFLFLSTRSNDLQSDFDAPLFRGRNGA